MFAFKYDISLPVWCLHNCIVSAYLCYSSHLHDDVLLPAWCLLVCMISADQCIMSSYLSSTVWSLLNWMISAYHHVWETGPLWHLQGKGHWHGHGYEHGHRTWIWSSEIWEIMCYHSTYVLPSGILQSGTVITKQKTNNAGIDPVPGWGEAVRHLWPSKGQRQCCPASLAQ